MCKRDERKGQSLLSCSVPSTWGKTSIYEVAFEQLKAKCSQERITQNRLRSHYVYESLSASFGSHTSYSEPLSEHSVHCTICLSPPLVCKLLVERDFIIFIFASLDPSTVHCLSQVPSKCLVNKLLLSFWGRRRE